MTRLSLSALRPAALALCGALALAAPATAALMDNFDGENGGAPALNFGSLARFDVVAGSVDLIGNGLFDAYPGEGLYIDTAGSTGAPGTLRSKEAFEPGAYLLVLQLGGPISVGSTSQLSVSFGDYSELFDLVALRVEVFVRSISLDAPGWLTIADAGTSLGNPNIGSTLFAVALVPEEGAGPAVEVPAPGALGLLGLALGGLILARRSR